MGTTAPITNFDPADAYTLADWEVLHAIGEGLLRREPGGDSLVPGIAEDMPEVSDDGQVYTFQLRPDLEFPDGTALTAPQYVDGLERVMELGGRGSDLISLYVTRIEAPDDTTVVFHLNDGYAFFPTLVTGTPYLALHPDALPSDILEPNPETPIYGAGPWYMERYSANEIVLNENPAHDRPEGSPRRIVIRVYGTTEEMSSALSSGTVDMLWRGLDDETSESLADLDDLNVAGVPGGTLHFLTINHADDPTNTHLVRQAVAELIDREAVIETVLGDAFEPAYSPIPPGFSSSVDVFQAVYGEPDLARAIEFLREAGYSEADPAQIELGYPPERFGLDIAAAIEEIELQVESTGLATVTLTAQPWSTYVGDVVDEVYDLAFLGWIPDFPDPHNYLAPFVLDGGLGGSGKNLESSELPGLVREASTEPDMQARSSLYTETQTLFAEDVVTLPLWIERENIAYREDLGGDESLPNPDALNLGPDLQLDFRTVELGTPEG